MVMQSMRRGKFSGLIKIFFMTLLVLATGGLVLTDAGGFFRGGVTGNNVAKVGGEKISIQSFDRTVQRTLPRLGISPQEAFEMGYMQQLLNGEIQTLVMTKAARDTGIEVSRDLIARQINELIEPMAQGDQSKQDVLNQLLMAQGLTEPEFVRQIGSQAAGGLLAEALKSGLARPSPEMVKGLYLYNNETRTAEIIAFPHADYTLENAPTEEELQTAYEGLKENYAIPESRDITLIVLDDKKLQSGIDITDEQLRATYDEDKNAFLVQEHRTLEQAILQDEDQANKIAEQVKNGTPLKDAVNNVTGGFKSYLGEDDFEKQGMLQEIRAVAFKDKETGSILGPVKTALGWHVFIVKNIKPAHLKPFASIKDDLRKEQMEIKLADQKYELSAQLEDLLASGAELAEISEQMDVKTYEIKDLNTLGQNKKGQDLLDSYGEDAALILTTAAETFEGESSPVIELVDGSFASVRVDKHYEKSYQPFEDVKDDLQKNWIASEKAVQNRKYVADFLKSGKTLPDIAGEAKRPIKMLENLTRGGEAPDPLIPATLPRIFAEKQDTLFQIDIKDGVALVNITTIKLPPAPDEKDLSDLEKTLETQESNEAISTFLTNKQKGYGVSINQTLLKQIYAPGETEY